VSTPTALVVVESVCVSCGTSLVVIVSRSWWPGSMVAWVGNTSICSSVIWPGVNGTCDAGVKGCQGGDSKHPRDHAASEQGRSNG